MFINVFFNNQQNFIKINKDLKFLLKFCCFLTLKLEKFNNNVEVSFLLTDNSEIKILNREYNNKNYATDVLSFSTKRLGRYFKYDEVFVLGDVVISVEKALEQFQRYGCVCVEEELARLAVHSMLHLLGYDHERDENSERLMRRKEKILNKIVNNKFRFERVSVYEK